jgi:hypothetical protein
MFESRVVKIIFGPKSYDVARGWRKLHNEKHLDLSCSPCIIKMIVPGRWNRRIGNTNII